MAASGEETVLGQLGQEATCPLCLDFFKQPMGLSCGHNFCRDCLAQLGAEASCPQCRARVEPGSAYPNQTLANVDGLVKRRRLSEGAHQEGKDHRLCQEHGQPLQLFCSREKSLLCPGCLGEHQGHPLLSLPEAAQEHKDLLDGLLEPLKKEGQKLLEQRQAEEQSRQECQEQFAAKKQKVGLALESLQELLREREPVWLAWLTKQEENMEAEWGVALAQLSGEASRLQQLVAQTERKCRQPDGEFLQDIQNTIDRCRSYVMGHVESVSPRLQGRLRTLLQKNISVRQVVDSYKDILQTRLTGEHLDRLLATVTLDVSTAHSRLQCQRSSVTWASRCQECPDVPERFSQEFCVLGCEGFTTGWHWWDVSVVDIDLISMWEYFARGRIQFKSTTRWAIGVAKESVSRKGSFRLSPQEGIWAVGKNVEGETVAFINFREKLCFKGPLQRLQVRLDHEAGKVEFLDAETEVSLHTFWTGPFLGETLRPFFCLGQPGVTLSM